jgi:integration host factor subunit beta
VTRITGYADLTISAYACDFCPGGGQAMIKSELVQRLAERHPHHLYVKDADRFVDVFLGEIEAALVRGDRVELRGFGAFTIKTRPARRGRNPKNGAFVASGKSGTRSLRWGSRCSPSLTRRRPAEKNDFDFQCCLKELMLYACS